MGEDLKLISPAYLETYLSLTQADWPDIIHRLRAKESFTGDDFEHYLISSSLYSSKIEGNTLDVNSFFRNRGNKDFPKKKEVKEVEDLSLAYRFAYENNLTKINFLHAHKALSQTLIAAKERGAIRKYQISVRDTKTLKPVYIAIEPELADEALSSLFADISELLSRDLSPGEIFYYASMVHLWIAVIHPFGDGNGRSERLAEKWFLTSKLGAAAWSIHSEKYYWDHRPEYYVNIALGYNYYALYWERCIPFLLMLPEALKESLG